MSILNFLIKAYKNKKITKNSDFCLFFAYFFIFYKKEEKNQAQHLLDNKLQDKALQKP